MDGFPNAAARLFMGGHRQDSRQKWNIEFTRTL